MEKQADGKVAKAKAESFWCINQCLGNGVWVKTTPARSSVLFGYTPSRSKHGFGAKTRTSSTGSSTAVVVQSSIQALKSTWDAKKKKKKKKYQLMWAQCHAAWLFTAVGNSFMGVPMVAWSLGCVSYGCVCKVSSKNPVKSLFLVLWQNLSSSLSLFCFTSAFMVV